MRPLFLKLKGFKGIKAGMNLEEIAIDFKDMPNGVVAFSAPNGTGKTTIMDCLHPYRIMPFRTGSYSPKAFSFYDHTYGEAAKELVFAAESTQYRSLVLIDPARKKQEAYLHVKDGSEWKPLNDGKVESYDTAVEGLLGTPELFFMSVFRAQNAKSLTAYSKGDIKEIFTELLGIDHLKVLSEKAGVFKAAQQQTLNSLRAEKSILTETVARKDVVESKLSEVTASSMQIRNQMDDLTSGIEVIREKLTAVDIELAARQKLTERKREIEADISARKQRLEAYISEQEKRTDSIEAKVFSVSQKISNIRTLIAQFPVLEKAEHEKTEQSAHLKNLKDNLKKTDNEYTALNSRIALSARTEGQIANMHRQLQKLRLERDSTWRLVRQNLETAQAQQRKLQNTPCGGSLAESCAFVQSAVAEAKKIPELEAKLADLGEETAGEAKLTSELACLEQQIALNGNLNEKAEKLLNEKRVLQAQISTLETNIGELEKSLADLPRIKLAEAELPAMQGELASLEAELETVLMTAARQKQTDEAEIASLEAKAAGIKCSDKSELDSRKESLSLEMNRVKSEKETLAGKLGDLAVRKGSLDAEAARITEAEKKVSDIAVKEAAVSTDVSEWLLLEKALGNDGLIALEISDAGPQITTYANELLKVIGGRFSVKIETQFIKAKGGTKEGFDIIVYDGRTNEAKSLKLLSGGEKTWVEEAITRAICLYRATASGIKYECLFSDEKDGALDTEKKKEFFDMKQRVLELGGYRNEFCITQTDALLARANAVIELRKGKGAAIA